MKLTDSEKVFAAVLQRHYRPRSGKVLLQVPIQALGYDGKPRLRKADALVINPWSSKGREVHGFEMKNDRTGWTSDLENPQKAHDVAIYCDYWSILSAPKVVKESELPDGWGLAETTGEDIEWKRQPALIKSLEPNREFLFSIVTAVLEQHSTVLPEDVLAQRYQEGLRAGRKESQAAFTDTVSELRVRFAAKEAQYRQAAKPQSLPTDQMDGIREILSQGSKVAFPEKVKQFERIAGIISKFHSKKNQDNALAFLELASDDYALGLTDDLSSIRLNCKVMMQQIDHILDFIASAGRGEDEVEFSGS